MLKRWRVARSNYKSNGGLIKAEISKKGELKIKKILKKRDWLI